MHYRSVLLAGMLLTGSISADAATLNVGRGHDFSTLTAASAAADRGDTIMIHSGVYEGVSWYDDDLTIRRAPSAPVGSVIIRGAVERKALFVTKGDNISVRNIRFENAAVPDGNGAGIRSEGRNLTVVGSAFVGNENGILAAGPADNNTLAVIGSAFDKTRSRTARGIGHSIYVGKTISGLVVENSSFDRNTKGHYIKSRAESTIVRNSDIDDSYGSGSYLIEMPEGGTAIIEGNRLVKGRHTSQGTAIAYGFERYKGASYRNPEGEVRIEDNDFINYAPRRVTFFNNRTDTVAELSGNSFDMRRGSYIEAVGPHRNSGSKRSVTASELAANYGPDVETLFAPSAAGFGVLPHDMGFDVSLFAAMPMSAAPASFVETADVNSAAVPEPAMIGLFGLGMLGLFAARRNVR